MAALTNERAGKRRAVAYVNLDVFQRRPAVVNEEQIGPVKNAGATCAHAVPDRRSEDRVLDRENLKTDPANPDQRAFLDQMSIFDVAVLQRAPRFLGGVDWAGRAVSQTPGVIGMRMGQHNRVRMKPLEFPHPIEPAVDHHSGAAIGE